MNRFVNVAYCPTTEHVTVDLIGLDEGVPKALHSSKVRSTGIIVLGNVITILPPYLIGFLG